MLMVGFLEGIPSERGIADRCADSLSLRRFLGYGLTEATPEHSSFTVFRQRLPLAAFQAVHHVVLEALRAHGLLRGRNLGVDSSIIEANASLRGLVRRNCEQSYRDYVRELAREAGVEADDPAAVARFDRKRKGRTTSNQDWFNPHDPDAKVGRTKQGACDMVHKPQHIVDLESGAIVDAEVRPGDAGDTEELVEKILSAVETVERLQGAAACEGTSCVKTLTADKGYFDLSQLAILQHELGVRTVISDPQTGRRRRDKLEPEELQALTRAKRAVGSRSGKDLLKRRGEMIERGFAHTLDCGALRRTMLRGLQNINKRYLCGIFAFNLGLILRKNHGVGTPRQALAMAKAFLAWLRALQTGLRALRNTVMEIYMENQLVAHPIAPTETANQNFLKQLNLHRCSTGC